MIACYTMEASSIASRGKTTRPRGLRLSNWFASFDDFFEDQWVWVINKDFHREQADIIVKSFDF